MFKNNSSKYLVTLAITIALFMTAFGISSYANSKKTADLKGAEDKIAVDLLSSETQFDILKESSCSQLDNNILSDELDSLGNRLNYMEGQLGSTNEDVVQLKKYYSILQIKDYLLMKKYASDCKHQPVSVLYFYDNACNDCTRQGYVLTYLRDTYPTLRIYSFDYGLDLSALKTLISINKVNDTTLPALLINGTTYTGYKSTEELEAIIGPMLPVATSTGTTTKK